LTSFVPDLIPREKKYLSLTATNNPGSFSVDSTSGGSQCEANNTTQRDVPRKRKQSTTLMNVKEIVLHCATTKISVQHEIAHQLQVLLCEWKTQYEHGRTITRNNKKIVLQIALPIHKLDNSVVGTAIW